MVVSPFLKPIAYLAGGLGLAQSLAWIIMSIIGLASYFCHIEPYPHATFLPTVIQLIYFTGPECYEWFLGLYPQWALVAMVGSFLYLFGSLAWLAASGALLLNTKSQDRTKAPPFLIAWITVTFLISILDILFGLFFGLNYAENEEKDFIIATSSAVLMTVALRGFVLWIVNVTCAALLCKFTSQVIQDNKELTGRENYDYPMARPAWNTGSPEPSPRLPPWDKNYRDSQLGPQYGPHSPMSPQRPAQRPPAPPPQRAPAPSAPTPYRHDDRPDYDGYGNQPRPANNAQYGRSRPPPLNLGGGNAYGQPAPRPVTEPKPDYAGPTIPKLNPSMNRDYNRGNNRMY